jgi:uncharacterized protein
MAQGEINHIEIPSDDPERTKRFYEAVVGWQFTDSGFPDYWLFRSGPGEIGGGLGKRGETAGQQLRNYVLVDSIEDALAAATANGGTIISEKSEIPGQGWFAAVTDPDGNELGFYIRAG